jgi:iron complex transport system ATP-binding protein
LELPDHKIKREEDPADRWTAFKDVTFIRNRRTILDGIQWSVHPREHWVVMGANGSGKTTLLRLLAGYLWPTRGEMIVLGERFGHVDLRELRKKIGWVGSFLEAQIPSSQSPLDLIVSGKFASIGVYEHPTKEDYERARQVAQVLRCDHILDSPYGVLSQGEKQRLLIARAMIHTPQLLILDEPCAGLDLVAREGLLQMLQSLGESAEAPTMVLVTHQMEEIMPVFTHVILLREGKCLASGKKEEILNSRLLSETFGIRIQVVEEWNRYRASVSHG